MNRAKVVLLTLFGMVVVLIIVQVAVSNSISTAGIQLEKLQTDITQIEKENAQLHEAYLTLASYRHIASAAGELGFKETSSVMSVSVPTSFAYKR